MKRDEYKMTQQVDTTDYKQKYEQALERAKKGECIENIFPELRESEDEKWRKWLIGHLKGYINQTDDKYAEVCKKAIAWLEKQGEHSNFRNKIQIGDKVTRNEDGVLVNLSQFKRMAKQSEQKPADKVEPKFKVGDWITLADGIALEKVVEFDGNKVRLIDTDGVYMSCPQSWLNDYHLWTIQDAKDGDILMARAPFIFNGNLGGGIDGHGAHCGINTLGEFQIPKNPVDWTGYPITPASKEQRDLLFQKMKEAGYEWDSEKKELKKISAQSSWSEEDEKMFNEVILDLTRLRNKDSGEEGKVAYQREIDWLESLKLQLAWKPIETQDTPYDLFFADEEEPKKALRMNKEEALQQYEYEKQLFEQWGGTSIITFKEWLEIKSIVLADEKDELTEFEEEILNLLNCATPEGHGAPTIEKTKEYSQKLLDLARKELEENYYTKVVDDRMVFKSELHATDLQTAYDMGKQDTLKSLPNWEKCDDNLPYSHIGGLNEMYLIKNGYCIKISDLETLPKEK